ncbi:MAG: Eco57I restriction-modification methylase domain-containing protein, partial [Rothia sp. (in: high G+C Gram-positive bacteria)]|nr:Eco57I restriction-modification methylase domain-containing protein [Rothia sp. (in: high G+C Gram-positive bacteria)]
PIYHKFMEISYRVADKVCLITPARFLFNAGATPKEFNTARLNDKHFKVVYYEQDSAKVFPNTDIKGGVAVTYRDVDQNFGSIETYISIPEVRNICKKVDEIRVDSLSGIISGRGVYRFTDIALKERPEIEDIQSKGHKWDVGTGVFKLFDAILFFDEKPQGEGFIKILGLSENSRKYMWVDSRFINKPGNLNKYKVILPKANGSGAIGEVLSTPLIGTPLIGFTETFISIGEFDELTEAENCLKYVKSKFCRVMLGVLKITQDNTRDKWAKVPMQDFTSASDVPWQKPIPEIDRYFYQKYGLSQEEIDFIETNVKPMD